MVRFGVSSSQDDQPSAGFEELAMHLFESFYNFARAGWFTAPETPRTSTRDLSQGFTQFCFVSVRQQVPNVDVSNPEEHVSEFLLTTGAA